MADDNADQGTTTEEATAANQPAADTPAPDAAPDPAKPVKKAAAKKATKRAPAKKVAVKKTAASGDDEAAAESAGSGAQAKSPAKKTTTKKVAAKTTTAKAPKKIVAADEASPEAPAATASDAGSGAPMPLFQTPESTPAPRSRRAPAKKAAAAATAEPLPDADEPVAEGDAAAAAPAKKTARKRTSSAARAAAEDAQDETATPGPDAKARRATASDDSSDENDDDPDDDSDDESGEGGPRRRRRRGGRRRRKSGDGGGQGDGSGDGQNSSGQNSSGQDSGGQDSGGQKSGGQKSGGQKSGGQGGQRNQGGQQGSGGNGNGNDSGAADDEESGDGTSRRRRRRRREGDDGDTGGGNGGGNGGEDPNNTTTRVRRPRSPEDEITAISGSTRLEAKKQRRRDGREAGRRRAPIVSEAEFLARRESVERVMTIRQRKDVIQIGVLEDKVLVEHYVARESQTSLIGNVYLGRVQNVLPSMEAAFVDIGKGRNAVLYAGEVNWSALGHKEGAPRKIESVLSSGQTILVQVTKDPMGHKGARLTSQVSLAGRFLVYVPDGTTSGISRKLPDTERNRLKTLLKEIVPSSAGVIVRTAAEGASEEELTQDVERLKARWEDIEAKSGGKAKGGAPHQLYGEPDLTLKVVRDLFTEDFAKLVISGDDAWETVRGYVADIAPDLERRLQKYDPAEHNGADLFATYRVDEQIAKALDRKVFLPSGGSLVIDRTEAMTVVDVNTGKFTGSGGNLEETVTKNNLEAAEEVVRQLRLRDIGGIIVVDFIDMVLESNRDLVLRRMVECLGRDRTRHQVAEVTSLGLIQMTRKRIGTGLLESFSENCQHCQGRGVVVHDMPIEPRQGDDDEPRRGGGGAGGGGRRRGGRRTQDEESAEQPSDSGSTSSKPSPAEFAAMAKVERAREEQASDSESEKPPERVESPESPESLEKGAKAAKPTKAPQTAVEPEQPTQPTGEPAAPRVVTRTRRGASRPSPVSTASEPTSEPAETVVADQAPVAETPTVPEEPTPPVEPAAPRVVTRTRRGVTRTVATPPAEAVETPAPSIAPVTVPVAGPVSDATPEPPRVVTRTRGQSAARRTTPEPTPEASPAQTPSMGEVAATSGQIGSPPESGVVEPVTADMEPGSDTPPSQTGNESGSETGSEGPAHVPVKRKGTRKR